MSEELADWIAAYDQVRAETESVVRRRRPFVIAWIEEAEDGKEYVASSGLFRPGDENHFVYMLVQRMMTMEGTVFTNAPPEKEP